MLVLTTITRVHARGVIRLTYQVDRQQMFSIELTPAGIADNLFDDIVDRSQNWFPFLKTLPLFKELMLEKWKRDHQEENITS